MNSKPLLSLAIATLALLLNAAEFRHNQFFAYDRLPAELSGVVAPGKDLDLQIEENGTTGYLWSASYDPRLVQVKIDHKPPRRNSNLVGSPGYAEISIRPLTPRPVAVVLGYSRSFEPKVPPVKTVRITVTPQALPPAPPVVVQPVRPAPPVVVQPVRPAPPAVVQPVRPAPPVVVQPHHPAPPVVVQPVRPMPQFAVPADALPLRDDMNLRFARIPAALRADLHAGKSLDFTLEENPAQALFWAARSSDETVCRVKLDHEKGGWFSRPKAEIKLYAGRRGFAIVDFFCGPPPQQRIVRCFVIVQ